MSKVNRGYAFLIGKRAERLRAAAERTENVEQLEAIERDFERLIGQARRISEMQIADCRSRRAGRGSSPGGLR